MPKNSIADALRRAFGAACIVPDDAGYDAARTGYLGGFDKKPAAIVRVRDAGEVARVVGFAREVGVELAVRGGGHSFAGHSSSDGGIVLDLREMNAIDIDAAFPNRVGGDRRDHGRVHQGGRGARPCRRLRRRRQRRHRRHYARRRRRLPRPEARPDDRFAARRRGGHRGREDGLHRRGLRAGPVLGDPRRRRQFRRGHPAANSASMNSPPSPAACCSSRPRRRTSPASSRRLRRRPMRSRPSSTSCRRRPCPSCRRRSGAGSSSWA